MKRTTLLTSALAALLLMLGVAAAQQSGGTLRAAWAPNPVSLDPHVTSARASYQVFENVIDTLVELDEDLNIVPSLAHSWDVSDDGLVWTFYLRENATFGNGRPMTAEDVLYSHERLTDPETGSGNAYLLDNVESMEVIDDYTIEYTLNLPSGTFLSNLSKNKSVGIIARESVEDGTIGSMPLGTGPFVITDFEPGVSIMLERNEDYWQEGLPYLDAIEIRIILDDSVRRTALISGDVDWVISLPPQDVEDLMDNDDVVVDTVPAGGYWYIGLNLEREPFSDERVRQAIAYAINRENITAAATFGLGEPTQDPIPSTSPWAYNYAPFEQDIERAQALMVEAGYPDGFEMQIMPTTEYGESIRAAQVIQADLAQIGIQTDIFSPEWAQWLEEQGDGNYDTYVCSWNGLTDPDDFYFAQHRTGEVFNFTGYSNPSVDELLDEGRRESDQEVRYEIYEQVNQMIVDDAPYIYLYNLAEVNAYQPYVQGYNTRADQVIRFTYTWLDR